MSYNWQLKNWPNFQYQTKDIEDLLLDYAERTGKISGLLEGLTETSQTEAMIQTMISEAVKSSEIEGEFLNRSDVASSIRRNLGLDHDAPPVKDKRAQGIAELMLEVRNKFPEVLSKEMLFSWHSMLLKGKENVQLGTWRSHLEPMQIVSGAFGHEKIHFEAPPSARVPKEMDGFIKWFNDTSPSASAEIKKPVIRAAIAHLYFESIHPFEDGNGRIGRALCEMALSQSVNRLVLLSISKVIEARKSEYYEALQLAQRSNEITPWIAYFVQTALDAQIDAENEIEFTLRKTRFFDLHKSELNERQLKAISRMLDEGPMGFEGGMNTRKYISLTRTSKATATRDLQDLVQKNIFIPTGGGRSTHYKVNL
jgi:Fic family protein